MIWLVICDNKYLVCVCDLEIRDAAAVWLLLPEIQTQKQES